MKTCLRLHNYKYSLSLRSRKKTFTAPFLFRSKASSFFAPKRFSFGSAFGGKCGFRASDRPDGRSVLRRSEVRTAVARSFRTASPDREILRKYEAISSFGENFRIYSDFAKKFAFLCMMHKRFNCKKSFTTAHLAFASRFSALFSHILSRNCKVCITGDKKRN